MMETKQNNGTKKLHILNNHAFQANIEREMQTC